MQDGQASEHETLRLLVRFGQKRLEKMEKALLRAGTGVPVHVRDVQLQGEKIGTVGDDAVGRLHRGLH